MTRLDLHPPHEDPSLVAERARWLEARKGTIGGSSCAAAVGLGKYGSRLRLWAEMTGKLPAEKPESEVMRWGNVLEDTVAREVVERAGYGLVVEVPPAYTGSTYLGAGYESAGECVGLYAFKEGPAQPLYRSGARPWQTYSPDGFVCTEPGERCGLLEVKTTGIWMGGEWQDDPPEHVILQVQHGMAVLGLPYALVVVLVAGNDPRAFRIERDEDMIQALNNFEAEFMEHVTAGTRPPFEDPFHPDSLEVLKQLHPDDNGETVQLPEATHEIAMEIENERAIAKTAQGLVKKWEAEIRALMGDATFAQTTEDMDGGRYDLSLKTTERHNKAREASVSKYRTLRVKKWEPIT